jgi:hypothetical protein
MNEPGDVERRLRSLRRAPLPDDLRPRVLARAAARIDSRRRGAPRIADAPSVPRFAWAAILVMAVAIPIADRLWLPGAPVGAEPPREGSAAMDDLTAQLGAPEPLVRALLMGRPPAPERNDRERGRTDDLEEVL